MSFKRSLILIILVAMAIYFQPVARVLGSFILAIIILVLSFLFGTRRIVTLAEKIIFTFARIFLGIQSAGNILKLLYVLKETNNKEQKKKKGQNELQIPNVKVPFPIPERYSKPGVSEQPKSLIAQQLAIIAKDTGHSIGDVIKRSYNPSQTLLDQLNVRNTMKVQEIQSVDLIVKELTQENNFIAQEVLFGELMFNGQDPYAAKKYTKKDSYDFPSSAAIQKEYQKAIVAALTPSAANPHDADALALAKITSEDLQAFVNPDNVNSNTYCFFFQHIEQLTKGKTLEFAPNIYYDSQIVVGTAILQTPYAVFTYQEKENRFICLAIAIRFESGKIGVYSPYRKAKGHTAQTWKMAKQIAASVTFNDFSVRVHLGVLHFSTSQYNVPIYNFLADLPQERQHRFEQFLHYTLQMFNRGLEGVNVAATATLVHPTPELSIINSVFVFNSESAVTLLKTMANLVNLNKWNPEALAKKKGLQKIMSVQSAELSFDSKYFKILADYIREQWQIWGIGEFEAALLDRINSAREAMYVGLGEDEKLTAEKLRPAIEKGKLCEFFQNLMFSWVVYHSHTFSNIILAPYSEYKPSMLSKELPYEPQLGFTAKAALPHEKVLMESVKLTIATTVRDAGNFIIDVIQRRSEQARIRGVREESCRTTSQSLKKLRKGLEAVSQEVRKVNLARINERKFAMAWLDTNVMESSLNI